LDFGRCAESRNSQDRTYSRFSTSFRSTPRKLCDAWEDAKGCRSNLAKAEGLELPSPRESNYSTTAASCRTAHLPAPALIPRRDRRTERSSKSAIASLQWNWSRSLKRKRRWYEKNSCYVRQLTYSI